MMARTRLNTSFIKISDGTPVSTGTATVKIRDTSTLATLYTTETGGTVTSNPTIIITGRVDAWIDEGSYDITVSGSGFSTYTTSWESVRGDSSAHSRIINVKDYGAKGDNTTNDTTAIQTAFNAATVGSTVYFPTGTYRFTTLTCATDNVTFTGPGTLVTTMANDNVSVAVWLRGNGTVVDGLTFKNANPQTPFAHAAAGNVENGQTLIVGPANYLDPPNTIATVKNCYFYGAYSSQLEVRNTNDVIVENNRLYNNSGNGMGMENCLGDVLIKGNHVYNTGDDMIVVVTDTTKPGSTKRVTIVDNVCDTGDAKGIATTGADKLVIANNHVRNTFTFGIGVFQDGFYGLGASSNGSIHNNTLERIGFKYGADHALFLHDTIATVPNGIFVSVSENIDVHDNTILDTAGIGIVADTATIPTTTTGSHTFPVGTVNVVSTASMTTFGRVTIFDTNGNSATISYTGKTPTTLTGVTGGVGVFAAGSKVTGCLLGLKVNNNTIVGTGSTAIQISNPDGTDWIRVMDLDVCGNTCVRVSGGIAVGSSTNSQVLGNKVRSYKQGFVGARRGLLLGSNRNLVYDHNIIFNDDGGDEAILVYGTNKHVVDGGSNITNAPGDP